MISTDLDGNFLVNHLNLPNDVMRYDVTNTIMAAKQVAVVITEKLSIKDKIYIQNVDVLDWIHRAVLKYGGIARGKCIFHRETDFSKGIGYCIYTSNNVRLFDPFYHTSTA